MTNNAVTSRIPLFLNILPLPGSGSPNTFKVKSTSSEHPSTYILVQTTEDVSRQLSGASRYLTNGCKSDDTSSAVHTTPQHIDSKSKFTSAVVYLQFTPRISCSTKPPGPVLVTVDPLLSLIVHTIEAQSRQKDGSDTLETRQICTYTLDKIGDRRLLNKAFPTSADWNSNTKTHFPEDIARGKYNGTERETGLKAPGDDTGIRRSQ
ncbi:hypothetical protein ARMGADRAFT_1062185 [Armillaria gallica]|uniref:Uncharacterized protein n=1 Tax=Armillaria gallica TaxID=47427 RepID=A0A2H3DP18_ARMGA|nr:hypothetical protein ARMGADRAFT_1062185 [Armillaria gallica]